MMAVWGFAAGLLMQQSTAQAGGISSCGNIHVEAEATCEVRTGIECEGMCTPLSVQAACSAQLAADCSGGCDELPSVDCQGECTTSCEASCSDLEPGEFDCQGACEADCGGSCEASCEGEDDSAGCMAQCQGACTAGCEGSCDVELPEADCEAGCEASCEGSCEVDANLDCQLECQSEGFAECEAEVQGGCELACETEQGALFCDGQYVDHGDNLQECIDAIEAFIEAHVMVEGEASAESGCTDGEGCMVEARAEGRVTTDCSVGDPGRSTGTGGGAAALGLLAGLVCVRRRRRR
jgi:MYXO-CTERM domain-containing protein